MSCFHLRTMFLKPLFQITSGISLNRITGRLTGGASWIFQRLPYFKFFQLQAISPGVRVFKQFIIKAEVAVLTRRAVTMVIKSNGKADVRFILKGIKPLKRTFKLQVKNWS